jgi:hypothetical protein
MRIKLTGENLHNQDVSYSPDLFKPVDENVARDVGSISLITQKNAIKGEGSSISDYPLGDWYQDEDFGDHAKLIFPLGTDDSGAAKTLSHH